MTNFYEETERQRAYWLSQSSREQRDSSPSKSPQTQQTLTEYSDLPFWRWDLTSEEHLVQYDLNNGFCCFNHAIGLPAKGDKRFPIFDYERELFDAILTHKRIWVKKATGLGITEFMLRFMAWLALSPFTFPQINGNRQDSIFTIVTGPRIDLAIDLIDRLKHLFDTITFEDKNTVLNLGNVKIEAFPSHHLDSMRGLPNVKFILLDEADFFPKGQQQEARTVAERYIGKSDAYIAMVSTPNAPDGLFQSIESESQSLYHKIVLGWQRGLGTIYTEEDITQAKRSPSFEREYNLKYLGAIGNVFNPQDIDAIITEDYDIVEYLDDLSNFPYLQAIAGIDPGWGSSSFAISVTNFVDGKVRVLHSDQYNRPDHNEMVSVVWDLIQRYNITKILIDASAVSFIRALKLQWGEKTDYEKEPKELRQWMKVEPVSFGVEHKQMLYHVKFLLENRYLQIHPKFDKLITSLRSAYARDGTLDKEITSFDDVLDSFRLCLRAYKEHNTQ